MQRTRHTYVIKIKKTDLNVNYSIRSQENNKIIKKNIKMMKILTFGLPATRRRLVI